MTKQSCSTCEFDFYNDGICAGYGTRPDNGEPTYGMSISETKKIFPDGCDCWGISLDAFIKEEQSKKHREDQKSRSL